jgi:uncharacterized protein YejL (UPF0352 family)
MSTNNPFAKHTNGMFASRGCDVDAAIEYAGQILDALSSDKAAAMTALMVVINTAANAWTQSQGPSPAQEIAAAWVRDLVAQEIDKHSSTLQDKVSELVSEWVEGNLDGKLDDWVNNSLSFEDACDNRVERWIENNLDISDQIESAINDMDLVVRVR